MCCHYCLHEFHGISTDIANVAGSAKLSENLLKNDTVWLHVNPD